MPTTETTETTDQPDQVKTGLSAQPLTDEGAAALRQVRATLVEMDADQYNPQQQTSPHVERLDSGIRMNWGKDGEKKVSGDTADDTDPSDGDYSELTDAEVAEPGYAAMSLADKTKVHLKRLHDSGRCTPAEFQRMSLADVSTARAFVRHRAGLPMGACQSPAPDEISRTANWALGRKPVAAK